MSKFFRNLSIMATCFVILWPILLCFGVCAEDTTAFVHKMFILLVIGLITSFGGLLISLFVE